MHTCRYLHLYNDDTAYFITFWTPTYSPTILASIVTSGNAPSFSAYAVTLFLSFLKTNNISGYIMTPLMTEAFCDNNLSSHPLTTVPCHTLQHLLHFTHPSHTYANNSFKKSLPKNDLPTSVQSSVHIASLSRIYWIPNPFTLSICISISLTHTHTISLSL